MCKISEMNLETAKYYGYEAQSNQLVEECAELIQAVNKYRRSNRRWRDRRGIIQRVVHFVRKDVPLFSILSKNPPQK